MTNLLTQPLISTQPLGALTLPGLLAALARGEVEQFPAMRPHQGMFWHMFLVQLGALTLHGAGRADMPEDEEAWRSLLRKLTKDFPQDEPWRLVVGDRSKPAFLQPPVPEDVELKNEVPTPDALDLLITSKNHDLKQAVVHAAREEDWVFALVSLQTGEGYGGSGNQGIVRMNGGSSSRPMLSLAPLPTPRDRTQTPRPDAWFRRDLAFLLTNLGGREVLDFPAHGGLGLTWLADWPEEEQLQTRQLDPWFIEICRRVRLNLHDGRIHAFKGTSKATRINGKHLNGSLGDPWAPIHKSENKSFTLGDEGDFTYGLLTKLLFSGDWDLPLLARLASFETTASPLTLAAQALARGNSKTGGFKARHIPLSGSIARSLSLPDRRKALHETAGEMTKEIAVFDVALRDALALAASGGYDKKRKGQGDGAAGDSQDKLKKEHYASTNTARDAFDRYADTLFFEQLWNRYEAANDAACDAEKKMFINTLWERAQAVFDEALPAMPSPTLYRPRAEAQARSRLRYAVWKHFSSYLARPQTMKEKENDSIE